MSAIPQATMAPLLYRELVPWYRFLDPPEEHEAEATVFRNALKRGIDGPARTLLELGAGAGGNASFLAPHFTCTLTDLSEPMLELSRELVPECEHRVGDMRTLRLDRTFDAVLLHDAVVYMTTVDELRQAIQTAFVHTRPGGAAVIAPDFFREGFEEDTSVTECDAGDRSFRCMEWVWDPDPSDTTYLVEQAYLLREGLEVHAVHDRHCEGLFARATWVEVLTSAGFEVEGFYRPIEGGDVGATDEVFLCRRPHR